MNKHLLYLPILFLLTGCTVKNEGFYFSYYNYYCKLTSVGDIQGRSPQTGEILHSVPGYIDYTKLFKKDESFFNCQVTGTNLDNLHCESMFSFESVDGLISIHETFESRLDGKNIIILNNKSKETIGNIYVGTYACRWEFLYDINGDQTKEKLVAEFYKTKFNDLPDFVKK